MTEITIETEAAGAAASLFSRYHVGWETRDADLIASLHSPDTVFQVHDGSDAVIGNKALREHCAELFRLYDFGFEMRRSLFGARHWVFEWGMKINLVDLDGTGFAATIDMLDIVMFDEEGLVTRKDVYLNGAQYREAFALAGIAT